MVVFRGQKSNFKKRSKSYSAKGARVSLGKDKSIKLQDIAKGDFIIKTEVPRTSTIKTKSFLPGVKRKKLVNRNTSGDYTESNDICKFLFLKASEFINMNTQPIS